jgi:hypothetical protein
MKICKYGQNRLFWPTRYQMLTILCSSLVGGVCLGACSTAPSATAANAGIERPDAPGTVGTYGQGGASSVSITTSPASTAGTNAPVTGAAGGASTGTSAPGCTTPAKPEDLIADFEDGFGHVQQIPGVRGGGFYAANDGTGTQTPGAGLSEAPAASPENHCSGAYVFCSKGSGFTKWGALIGTDVGVTEASVKKPFDASAYSGISFAIKSNSGTPTMKVKFPDKDTAPEGGLCDKNESSGTKACYDDFLSTVPLTASWTPVTIKFSSLRQAGWGMPATAFDAKTLYSLQLQFDQLVDFDFCIDDLMFIP